MINPNDTETHNLVSKNRKTYIVFKYFQVMRMWMVISLFPLNIFKFSRGSFEAFTHVHPNAIINFAKWWKNIFSLSFILHSRFWSCRWKNYSFQCLSMFSRKQIKRNTKSSTIFVLAMLWIILLLTERYCYELSISL